MAARAEQAIPSYEAALHGRAGCNKGRPNPGGSCYAARRVQCIAAEPLNTGHDDFVARLRIAGRCRDDANRKVFCPQGETSLTMVPQPLQLERDLTYYALRGTTIFVGTLLVRALSPWWPFP